MAKNSQTLKTEVKGELADLKEEILGKASNFNGKTLSAKEREELFKEYREIITEIKKLEFAEKISGSKKISKYNESRKNENDKLKISKKFTIKDKKYFKNLNGYTVYVPANIEEAKKDKAAISAEMTRGMLAFGLNVTLEKVISMLRPEVAKEFIQICKYDNALQQDLAGMYEFVKGVKNHANVENLAQLYTMFNFNDKTMAMIDMYFNVPVSNQLKDFCKGRKERILEIAGGNMEIAKDIAQNEYVTTKHTATLSVSSEDLQKDYVPSSQVSTPILDAVKEIFNKPQSATSNSANVWKQYVSDNLLKGMSKQQIAEVKKIDAPTFEVAKLIVNRPPSEEVSKKHKEIDIILASTKDPKERKIILRKELLELSNIKSKENEEIISHYFDQKAKNPRLQDDIQLKEHTIKTSELQIGQAIEIARQTKTSDLLEKYLYHKIKLNNIATDAPEYAEARTEYESASRQMIEDRREVTAEHFGVNEKLRVAHDKESEYYKIITRVKEIDKILDKYNSKEVSVYSTQYIEALKAERAELTERYQKLKIEDTEKAKLNPQTLTNIEYLRAIKEDKIVVSKEIKDKLMKEQRTRGESQREITVNEGTKKVDELFEIVNNENSEFAQADEMIKVIGSVLSAMDEESKLKTIDEYLSKIDESSKKLKEILGQLDKDDPRREIIIEKLKALGQVKNSIENKKSIHEKQKTQKEKPKTKTVISKVDTLNEINELNSILDKPKLSENETCVKAGLIKSKISIILDKHAKRVTPEEFDNLEATIDKWIEKLSYFEGISLDSQRIKKIKESFVQLKESIHKAKQYSAESQKQTDSDAQENQSEAKGEASADAKAKEEKEGHSPDGKSQESSGEEKGAEVEVSVEATIEREPKDKSVIETVNGFVVGEASSDALLAESEQEHVEAKGMSGPSEPELSEAELLEQGLVKAKVDSIPS